MKTTDKKKKIIDWMSKTIERLPIAQYQKNNRSGKYRRVQLHIAETLCICCFIDALGGYIFGGGTLKQANQCNFKRFIATYMPDLYRSFIEKTIKEKDNYREKYVDQFYYEVRCGLVHEYLPKTKNGKGSYIQSKNCTDIISGVKDELRVCLPLLRKSFKECLQKAMNDMPNLQ